MAEVVRELTEREVQAVRRAKESAQAYVWGRQDAGEGEHNTEVAMAFGEHYAGLKRDYLAERAYMLPNLARAWAVWVIAQGDGFDLVPTPVSELSAGARFRMHSDCYQVNEFLSFSPPAGWSDTGTLAYRVLVSGYLDAHDQGRRETQARRGTFLVYVETRKG